MRSSLGFHTMTLSLLLQWKDVPRLIKHFRKYSHNTGLIQMYTVDREKNYLKYQPKYIDGDLLCPTNLHIKYYKEDKGIKWIIQSHKREDFNSYIVKVKINPKLLAGISDYITASSYKDMDAAIARFDCISKEISPLLGNFDCYRIQRIDYCINFNVGELLSRCSLEHIMTLIRRADVPSHYTEWEKYNKTAHRTKGSPNSFYLKTSSVVINCYDKHAKLREQNQENMEKGYPPISQTTLDAAKGIIRFEIQCKYHKIYAMSCAAETSGDQNVNKYKSLLTHAVCADIISNYFERTIGKGDWHTLQDAIHIIESKHFNKQKEKRLIDALHLVNNCRSLAVAKAALKDDELKKFKKTLKDLASLNINPITIPKWWGIKYIPNLLYAYYDKVQEEISKKKTEKFEMECFDEYVRLHKCLPM